MNFSSPVFVFAFLPVIFLLNGLRKNIKYKNYVLTAGSLLFYSACRLDWFLILIVSIVFNYFAGLLVANEKFNRKLVLISAVTVNISVLFVFKYMNFFNGILSGISFMNIKPTNIPLPIGISFFTFQCLSYVVDVYRDPVQKANNISKLILYISFFPQLIAGPIIKYSDISGQIDFRKEDYTGTVKGIKRFAVGLSKKMFLANILGEVADAVYSLGAADVNFQIAWVGVICYTLQIYFDFSGYSDMAIGMGNMFGFKIKENFNYPYCASSVKDFWRRWHISLSSWFRDYLYIPIGGNRKGIRRTRLNKIIVFFFTGMWHGANWTFIIWGLWHAFALTTEDIVKKKIRIPNIVGHIYTLAVVCTGFMLFRSENLTQAFNMLRSMFSNFETGEKYKIIVCNLFTPSVIFCLTVSILVSMPVADKINILKMLKKNEFVSVFTVFVLMVLCMLKLATGSFNPFIYTQF